MAEKLYLKIPSLQALMLNRNRAVALGLTSFDLVSSPFPLYSIFYASLQLFPPTSFSPPKARGQAPGVSPKPCSPPCGSSPAVLASTRASPFTSKPSRPWPGHAAVALGSNPAPPGCLLLLLHAPPPDPAPPLAVLTTRRRPAPLRHRPARCCCRPSPSRPSAASVASTADHHLHHAAQLASSRPWRP